MTFFNGFHPESIIQIIIQNMSFQPLIAVSRFLELLGFLPPGLGGILSVSRFPLHTTQHFFVLRTYTV